MPEFPANTKRSQNVSKTSITFSERFVLVWVVGVCGGCVGVLCGACALDAIL